MQCQHLYQEKFPELIDIKTLLQGAILISRNHTLLINQSVVLQLLKNQVQPTFVMCVMSTWNFRKLMILFKGETTMIKITDLVTELAVEVSTWELQLLVQLKLLEIWMRWHMVHSIELWNIQIKQLEWICNLSNTMRNGIVKKNKRSLKLKEY